MRAPRLPVLRPRLRGLHRPREHHRHFQADAAGAPLRPPLLGPGADGRADHGDAAGDPGGPRCRRLPRRHPPLHPDAGRARDGFGDADDLLARPLRGGAGAPGRVPAHLRDEVDPQLNDPALKLLYEVPGLPVAFLPPPLGELHGGELGFRSPILYANFVTSLDGVTAISPLEPGQGGLISGGAPADRFLMGLLRSFAEVVVIGAGTLRAEERHLWTAERVYPPAVEAFGELRESLGLPPGPRLAVVSASGNVDPELPALAGGLILTTEAGASRLGGELPAGVKVVSLGGGALLDARAVVSALRAEGHRTILSEGGPHFFGDLLAAGLVDELFLTLSPVLAGRERSSAQVGLVEGVSLLPSIQRRGRLLSVRRAAEHLFLRYSLA
ncbi:MAG: hypothetical protein E6I85_00905 [Chloroflexi bacterium]|nr:MAG: hypothetical protein E6I85_00905 [Chloroflexota bacterium]